MKITFDHTNTNLNVDRATTAYRDTRPDRTARTGDYALDISGTVMDNNAYKGHGKTAEEVMQDAGLIDVATQRDYMTVMSNTMSEEDFDRLQRDGYHPGDMDIEEVVTIVDKIKAELVKGGTQIVGYTDDLDEETLEEITGSETFARELCRQFAMHDVPVTRENVTNAKQAYDRAAELRGPEDGTVRYMVENRIEPTVDGMYLAEHSSTADTRQSHGYYASDASGYYAKKAEEYNWEQLAPQMEKVLEEAGLEPTDENLEEAKWLVGSGIPLTAESVSRLHEIRQTELPQSTEQLLAAIAAAIADGKSAGSANLADGRSSLEKAADYVEACDGISGEAVDQAVAEGRELNLRNLVKAQEKIERYGVAEGTPEQISARRQLEEVRLMMTIEANRKLIESGYAIDTAELEELVDALRKLEAEQEQTLFREADSAAAAEKAQLYAQTRQKTAEIPYLPAAVLTEYISGEEPFTLDSVHENGTALKNAYEAARESYETLMTAPRADMGDSIRKAFRNVDDILADMGLETSEENRRAVRILGYNSMDITDDNIDAVKKYDMELRHAIRRMTPAVTLRAIREGRNPLQMSVAELNGYLDDIEAADTDDGEKFSRFLYKLEKNHNISEQERDAYIGIYRMFRQLEKTDDAAVGSLMLEGAQFTFQNLLTAMRSTKRQGMDYTVDDAFRGVEGVALNKTITEQIASGFSGDAEGSYPQETGAQQEKMAQEFYRTLTDDGLEQTYRKEQLQQYQELSSVEDEVIQELLAYRQPITANMLTAAAALRRDPKMLFKKLNDIDRSADKHKVKDAAAHLLDKLTDRESAAEAYEEMQGTFAEMLEEAQEESGTYLDLRTLQSCSKQLALAGSLAGEENYQIPVEIEGEWTAINLKILHGGETGKVTAVMDTEAYGRVTAQFSVKEQTVSGYIACDSEEGTRRLREKERSLRETLFVDTDGGALKAGDIGIVYSREVSVKDFAKEERTRDVRVGTADLYRIAKSFISSVAA